MLSWKKSLLLISLLLASSSAWSELVIRVTQGNDKPTIIAVSPIALNGIQIEEDIGRIIEGDLTRSGLFSAMPRRDMLAFPATAKDVYFRDWRILGTEYLVVGSLVAIDDGSYQLDFSLLSVTGQKAVFEHSVRGTKVQMRDLATKYTRRLLEFVGRSQRVLPMSPLIGSRVSLFIGSMFLILTVPGKN